MRSCDLQGKRVVTEAGRRLGRVDEIHTEDGRVTALVCGGLGLLQRFVSSRKGCRIEWSRVRAVDARQIVVAELSTAGRGPAGRTRRKPPSAP